MAGLVQRYHELRLPRCDCLAGECEDAAAGDPARGRFAVADGTGESAHAGLWARLLVEDFVAAGLEPPWPSRLPALRERWAKAASHAAGADLPWYLEARLREGAYATFLGVVLKVDDAGCRWHALAVGDSCLFHVRGGELLEAFPMARAADFGNTPWLVGSRGEPARIERQQGEARPGDRIWLMTDALAAWFLRRHEDGGRPWEEVQEVEGKSTAVFESWVIGLRRRRLLRDDDVTLVGIAL